MTPPFVFPSSLPEIHAMICRVKSRSFRGEEPAAPRPPPPAPVFTEDGLLAPPRGPFEGYPPVSYSAHTQ